MGNPRRSRASVTLPATLPGTSPLNTTSMSPLTSAAVSLPHLDEREANVLSLERFSVPFLPLLPRRSGLETPISQALIGIHGISAGPHGSISIDVNRLDANAPVTTSLTPDTFGGVVAGLDYLRTRENIGLVKWQVAGPVSLGIALIRAGTKPSTAFEVARAAVKSRITALGEAVGAVATQATQLVTIHEAFARDIDLTDFPLSRLEAVDLMASVLAAAASFGPVAITAGRGAKPIYLIEAGPNVVGIRIDEVADAARYIADFVTHGGIIAWGFIRVNGPQAATPTIDLRRLASSWHNLLRYGADLDELRHRAIIEPDGDLSAHSVPIVQHMVDLLDEAAAVVGSSTRMRRFLQAAQHA